MKTTRLFTFVFLTTVSGISSAQQTITSIADGNATNIFIWDCTCIPTPDDSVNIAHDVVMNSDWIVNSGGSIHVLSQGTFIEDSQHRTILIDGSGSSFINEGITELTNLSFSTGSTGLNNNTMSLDTGLYVCPTCAFTNSGSLQDLDSTFTQGTFNNSGYLGSGDLWNDGDFTNSGTIDVDSLLNTSSFITTNGIITCYDYATDGDFQISNLASFFVLNNFYNSGDASIAAGRTMHVGNDFFNSDTINGTALITNNGLIEIFNDFYNTEDMDGSGYYCIGNYTANSGTLSGTFDFCDNTGGNMDLNTGTIGAGITFCATNCAVGLDEESVEALTIYPNPAQDMIQIDGLEVSTAFSITDLSGRMVQSGRTSQNIYIQNLDDGIYMLNIYFDHHIQSLKFIKE